MDFILKQIIFAERHANGEELTDILPNSSVPWGLRTVDGSYNNLIPGQESFGQADQEFPSSTIRKYRPAQEFSAPYKLIGEDVQGQPTNYNQGDGKTVQDSTARLISRAICNQSTDNPAALIASEGAIMEEATFTGIKQVSIPNVAVDEGLSAPMNAFTTFFGQFFDHGLDLINKGGNGLVYMPLQLDDPLYDTTPGAHNFMLLTRATRDAGLDGVIGTADDISAPINATTPHVDQQQTYASHPSSHMLLRHYELGEEDGRPYATGRLLNGFGNDGILDNEDDGGMATWDTMQLQALQKLGFILDDHDGDNVPMFVVDPYGKFIPGSMRGFPQLVIGPDDFVEGDLANPVDASQAMRVNHSFFIDVAHSAHPGGKSPDDDNVINARTDTISGQRTRGIRADGEPLADGTQTYDDELLGAHFTCGDGRCNENIALTTIHSIFHREHNRLVNIAKRVVLDNGDLATLNEWLDAPISAVPALGLDFSISDASLTHQEEAQTAIDALGLDWNGERLFQAARFGTEMQYNRVVFDEFVPTLAGLKDAFEAFHTEKDPSIRNEFSQSVYRFGHSMLTSTVDRLDADFKPIADTHTNDATQLGLFEAFLNPLALYNAGQDGMAQLGAEEATGAVIRGLTRTQANEIDEFVTGVLQNNLVGLPLDLGAINIARGRDVGNPPLNDVRRMFFAETLDTRMTPYKSWVDYLDNLRHEATLVNFIAVYGTHPSIAGPDGINGNADDPHQALVGKRRVACAIVGALSNDATSYCADTQFINAGCNGLVGYRPLVRNASTTEEGARLDITIPNVPLALFENTDTVFPPGFGATAMQSVNNLSLTFTNAAGTETGTFEPTIVAIRKDSLVTVNTDPAMVAAGDLVTMGVDPNNVDILWSIRGPEAEPLVNGETTISLALEDCGEFATATVEGDSSLNNAQDVLFTRVDGQIPVTSIPAQPCSKTCELDLGTACFEEQSRALQQCLDNSADADDLATCTAAANDAAMLCTDAIPDTISDCLADCAGFENSIPQGGTATFNAGETDITSLASPTDAKDFLYSRGDWEGVNTGLDDVDLWNGGLAEERMPFGGFLGSTHNFVFETQMESLQNGDRFYYVARTATINFFSELESNSFTSLIMRNTDLGQEGAGSLHLNVFSLPTHTLEINFANQADPDPEDESDLVGLVIRDPSLSTTNIEVKDPDLFLQYTGGDHVVLGGSSGDDTMIGGIGDDTIWGRSGDDRIEGGDGADLLEGGPGDDIITDLSGPDVIEGGAGNDAISSGNEEDVIFGDEGHDFIVNSSELGEIFAGQGNDFIFDGDHNGHIRGGAGDDWIENLGGGEDLFQADNGAAPEGGEPVIKGHDVFIGHGGNNDADMENGDDIVVDGPGIERVEGQLGFDWVSFANDRFGVDIDLDLSVFEQVTLASDSTVLNRYDRVEGIGGSPYGDILRGTANDPGESSGNELVNFDLIHGLQALVPMDERGDLPNDPLTGEAQYGWTGGEIIVSGAGSDVLVGEGGNDILDGDSALSVKLLAEGTLWDGMRDLFEPVFLGDLNPGDISIHRDIFDADPDNLDTDTAVFSGNSTDYNIENIAPTEPTEADMALEEAEAMAVVAAQLLAVTTAAAADMLAAEAAQQTAISAALSADASDAAATAAAASAAAATTAAQAAVTALAAAADMLDAASAQNDAAAGAAAQAAAAAASAAAAAAVATAAVAAADAEVAAIEALAAAEAVVLAITAAGGNLNITDTILDQASAAADAAAAAAITASEIAAAAADAAAMADSDAMSAEEAAAAVELLLIAANEAAADSEEAMAAVNALVAMAAADAADGAADAAIAAAAAEGAAAEAAAAEAAANAAAAVAAVSAATAEFLAQETNVVGAGNVGFLRVTDTRPLPDNLRAGRPGNEGMDLVRNVERLAFADGTIVVPLGTAGSAGSSNNTPVTGMATIGITMATDAAGGPCTILTATTDTVMDADNTDVADTLAEEVCIAGCDDAEMSAMTSCFDATTQASATVALSMDMVADMEECMANVRATTLSCKAVCDVDNVNAEDVNWTWEVELEAGSGFFEPIMRPGGETGAGELVEVRGQTLLVTAAEAGLRVRVVGIFRDAEGVFEIIRSEPIFVGNPAGTLNPDGPATFVGNCAVFGSITPVIENPSRDGLPRLDFTIESAPLSLFSNTEGIFGPEILGGVEQLVSGLALTFVNMESMLVTGTFAPEIVAITDLTTGVVDQNNVNISWSIRGDDVSELVDGPTSVSFTSNGCVAFATAVLMGDSSDNSAQGVMIAMINGMFPTPADPIPPADFNGVCLGLENYPIFVENNSRDGRPRLDITIPGVALNLFDNAVTMFGAATEQLVGNLSLTFTSEAGSGVTGIFFPEIVASTDAMGDIVDGKVDILWSIRGDDVSPLVFGPTTMTINVTGDLECNEAFATATLVGRSNVNDATDVVVTEVNDGIPVPAEPVPAAFYTGGCNGLVGSLEGFDIFVENRSELDRPRLDITIVNVPLASFSSTGDVFTPGFGGGAEQLVENLSLTFTTQASGFVTGIFLPEIVAITDPVTLAVDPENVDILWSIRGDDVAPLVDGPTTITFRNVTSGCDPDAPFATTNVRGDSEDDAQSVVVALVNGLAPLIRPLLNGTQVPAVFNGTCADIKAFSIFVENASRPDTARLDITIPSVPLALFSTTETVFLPGFGDTAEQLVGNLSFSFVNQSSFFVTGTFSPNIVAITDPVTLAVDPNNVDILWSIRGTDVLPLVNGMTNATFTLDSCGMFATAVLDGDSSVNDAQDVVFVDLNGSPSLPPPVLFNGSCANLGGFRPIVENASTPGTARLDIVIPAVPLTLFNNTASVFSSGFGSAAAVDVESIKLTFVTQGNSAVTGTFSPQIVAITDPVTLAVDPLNVNIVWSIRGADVTPLVDGPTIVPFTIDSCGLFATAELDGDSSIDDAQDVVFTAVNGSPLPVPGTLASFNGTCTDLADLTTVVENTSTLGAPRLDVTIPAVPLALFDDMALVFAPGFDGTAEQSVENISLSFTTDATSILTGAFFPEIVAITDPVTLAVDPLNVNIVWSIRGADLTPLVNGPTTATFNLGICGLFAYAELDGDSTVNDAQGVVLTSVNGIEPPPRFLRGECDGDGFVDLNDALCSLKWQLLGGKTPGCIASLNANGDRRVDIADVIRLLTYIIIGGLQPVEPFPACGPSVLAADEVLGCETPTATCSEE